MAGNQVKVHIESMAFKGYGVARVQGKVLFIPYTVKDDEAWVEITEEKKNFSFGKVNQIIRPSSSRADPQCPYFGRCGGCQWQHIGIGMQAEFKKEIFNQILRRLGNLKEIPPITLIPSPQAYGYRVRVQLKVDGQTIGYYQEKSHHLIDVDHCPIAHPLVNQMISLLRETVSSLPPLEGVDISVSPEENQGVFIFHGLPFSSRTEQMLKKLLHENPVLKGIAFAGNRRSEFVGDPCLHFTFCYNRGNETQSLKFRTSPGSFFQVNPVQNQRLVETVLTFGDLRGDEVGLDLYSGVGNFTLPLAAGGQAMWGIEENAVAVKDARFNGKRNGIERCDFILGRVEEYLKDFERKNLSLVVLDPPRAGGKKIMEKIAGLRSKRIVYVSCDPTTLSRDLHYLSEHGYHLENLALIDLFPQTYHMEVVGLLTQSQG